MTTTSTDLTFDELAGLEPRLRDLLGECQAMTPPPGRTAESVFFGFGGVPRPSLKERMAQMG